MGTKLVKTTSNDVSVLEIQSTPDESIFWVAEKIYQII